jgi:hypothetical protein
MGSLPQIIGASRLGRRCANTNRPVLTNDELTEKSVAAGKLELLL